MSDELADELERLMQAGAPAGEMLAMIPTEMLHRLTWDVYPGSEERGKSLDLNPETREYLRKSRQAYSVLHLVLLGEYRSRVLGTERDES